MKKVAKFLPKIILVVVSLIVLGIFALIKIAEHRETNYYNYIQTSGEIEMKYTSSGSKNVSYMEFDANNDVIGKYTIWYPSELDSKDEKYPVVIFANGTGSTSATYKPFLEHLSSWGFISIGNDDKTPG